MEEAAIQPDAARASNALVSVVAPVLDEEELVERFVDRVRGALEGERFEIVIVDDGSSDTTPAILARLSEEDARVRVVTLSRNFGHQAAITAGLDHARGDAVVTIDSDLQDPPEVIPRLLERWRSGVDVVYAVRSSRQGESRFKLQTARWFYGLFARLANIDLEGAGDFRLMDRRVVDVLNAMPERNRFIRGLTVWVGFTQAAVAYERDARAAGETKYTLRKMARFSMDAIASFSHIPLQLATALGFLMSVVAFLAIPIAIVFRFTGVYEVDGVTSVLLAVLALGGIQLITVGIIGEYVGRIYDEVKGRPMYVVDSVAGEGSAPPQAPTPARVPERR